MSGDGRILLTGASGYVGGRLLPRLEATGRPVRCLARRPEYLRSRVGGSTEVVGGDLLDIRRVVVDVDAPRGGHPTVEPGVRGVDAAVDQLISLIGASTK